MADDNSISSEGTPPESMFRLSESYRLERVRSSALHSKNDQLQARVNQLDGELRIIQLWQENNIARQEMIRQTNERDLAVVQQERDRLREQLEAAEHTNEGLQVRENETLQAIASQQAANRSNEQQIALLRAQVESMNVSLHVEREKNEISRQEIAALENANGNLQARYDGLEAQANRGIEMSRQEIVALNDNVANLEEQLGALQIQHEGLQQEVESTEIEKEQAIVFQQAVSRSQEKQIADLRAQVESTNVSLAAERERNETSRQEIAELEQANGNLHAEKEALWHRRSKRMSNELLRQKMAELEQANGNLHAEKKALLEQNDKLTIENEGRVVEAIQDRQVIDETLHELGDMEMKLDEVQGERDEEVRVNELLRYENLR